MSAWHLEPMAVFDVETTGLDVEKDRIVTATVELIPSGTPDTDPAARLIAVDVDIPDEATAVHGITSQHAWEHGRPAPEVLEEVARDLVASLAAGMPVVGMNVAYDFTILDRELRRHSLPTLEERLGHPIAPVIDVFVLDKELDRYRRGGRKLVDLCAHYRVRHDGAHDAAQDALAAGRVAWKLAQLHPNVATLPLKDLHAYQVRWADGQARNFQQYLFRQANEEAAKADRARAGGNAEAAELFAADADRLRVRAADVDGYWPMRPWGGSA